MREKSFWIATSCSTAMILLTLMPLANARTYKNLHTFTKNGGYFLWAGLASDSAGNLYGTTSNGSFFNGTVFELSPSGDGAWKETVLYGFPPRQGEPAIPYAPVLFDTSGNLYGTTYEGGSHNLGTVFELTPNKDGSWSETVLYSFAGGQDGANPWAGLTFDANGNLFGTASVGGSDACKGGCGTVFELTPGIDGSWSEKVIYSFLGTDGRFPIGGLTFDAKGALYGTTTEGGPYDNAGTVFQLVPNGDGSWTENVLHFFGQKGDGASPEFGSLALDDQGNVYGTTSLGGPDRLDSGIAFELTPDGKGGWTETILHSFHGGSDGRRPLAGLLFDKGGNLYGTTAEGGRLNYGTIFRLTPTLNGRWHETILHVFQDRPGCGPIADLSLSPQGTFFGTTGGCGNTVGSVFELVP